MTREVMPFSWRMKSVEKKNPFYYPIMTEQEYLRMVIESKSTMEINEIIDVLIVTGADEIQVMRGMKVYSSTIRLGELNTYVLTKCWE